jgi:hypothetical protein
VVPEIVTGTGGFDAIEGSEVVGESLGARETCWVFEAGDLKMIVALEVEDLLSLTLGEVNQG